ncbi:hypothetical protein MJM45_29560, partial [Salmonella enterica subsp. enterica serovar Kentucky]|nr:hypothetical protein [Salmonella enterica subsp. enterica serovar Kentucky]
RGEVEGLRFYWLATGLVLALASIAAILHLAHPDRAYDALINLHDDRRQGGALHVHMKSHHQPQVERDVENIAHDQQDNRRPRILN